MEIHTKSLIELINIFKPETVVEVGVYKGTTAEKVLANCKWINKYWLVDLWEASNKPGSMYEKNDTQDKWEAIYNEVKTKFDNNDKVSIIRLASTEASKQFLTNKVDLVFIDANHTYEDVKKDIKAWIGCVKKGCILCGDDYYQFEVKKAVNEMLGTKVSSINNRIWWIKL